MRLKHREWASQAPHAGSTDSDWWAYIVAFRQLVEELGGDPDIAVACCFECGDRWRATDERPVHVEPGPEYMPEGVTLCGRCHEEGKCD